MSIEESATTTGESKVFIDMVLALVPDAAVIVDEDGLVISYNENLGILFGYEPDELVGRPIETMVPERFRHRHRGQRAGFLADPKVRAMGAGLDLYGRRKDGSEFPVDISLAPIRTAAGALVVAAVRDVSERRATEAAHAQLAAIVRSSLDAILATTLDGRITSWNPGAERTLGYTRDEILGEHLSRLIPDDQSGHVEMQLDAARRNETMPSDDTEWLTRSGERLAVAVSLSPMVDSGGRLTGFSVLLRDITQRKQVEAELRRLLLVSERQARLQEVSTEVRVAALAGEPLDRVFRLIVERTAELVGSSRVMLVRGDLVVASRGAPDVITGARVPMPALVEGEAMASFPREVLEPPFRDSFAGDVVLVAPITTTVGQDLVLLCDAGEDLEGLDAEQVVIGFAEQAVLAIELERARHDRERLLLADDRERIARDLHDHAVQSLFATGLGLQAALPMVDNEHVIERINEAVESLDSTIKQIRTAIFALSAPPRTGSTLRAQIVRLASEVGRGMGFEPSVSFDGPVDTVVPASIASAVVAVVREALSNVARHAAAKRCSVELAVTADRCRVRISDDGVGFTGHRAGNGLENLRTRAERLGGDLEVTSGPDQGTRLDWHVPLP